MKREIGKRKIDEKYDRFERLFGIKEKEERDRLIL